MSTTYRKSNIDSIMAKYTPTVGIEVHAELKTKSKMFCGCKNDPHASEANTNTNTCPVCMAHPGTLPTVNKGAVLSMMKIGRSIGGELATYSEFDRKNYFYPDIPKAYQLSQYQFPFVSGGVISNVEITRVHLEEDTARSLHDQGEGSLVDYNRAGVPLMEMVTEPVIHDSETAVTFAKELQLLLRTLNVSDANMERGEMRVEANISVSNNDTLGTKVEVKNLNSFKSVGSAIDYEVKRQIDLLEKGELVVQETRGWDENKNKTFSQRVKESADDYRYFPDPDIPKFDRTLISDFEESRIDEMLPKLATYKREHFRELGLTEEQTEIIIADMTLNNFFDSALELLEDKNLAKPLANYLVSDVLGMLDENHKLEKANPLGLASLVTMVKAGDITSRVVKDLLKEVVFDGQDAAVLAEERGLVQDNSKEGILPLVKQVVGDNPEVVSEYKAGKEASLKYLLGQGMKLSKGSANPQLLEELIRQEISSS